MATGNTLAILLPQMAVPPPTLYATLDTFAETTDTPDHTYLVLDFDDTTSECADFSFVMPSHYTASANLDVTIGWTCDTAGGTDGVIWNVSFKPITDDADDLDTTTFGTAQAFAESDPASAAGEMQYVDLTGITFAAAGSPLAGELVFVRLMRDHDDANDTLAADAEFHVMYIKEA